MFHTRTNRHVKFLVRLTYYGNKWVPITAPLPASGVANHVALMGRRPLPRSLTQLPEDGGPAARGAPLTLDDGHGLEPLQLAQEAGALRGLQAVDEVSGSPRGVDRLPRLVPRVSSQPAARRVSRHRSPSDRSEHRRPPAKREHRGRN